MNLNFRLKKLEQICPNNILVAGITDSCSNQILLSSGEFIHKDDLSQYSNLALFEFDPNQGSGKKLKQLTGNPKDVTATTVARLIVGWREILRNKVQ